jgi:hypothetical protein
VVAERQQLLLAVRDLGDGLGNFAPYAFAKALTALRALSLFSAFQISARAFCAPGCADFGIASRTFAILWNQ